VLSWIALTMAVVVLVAAGGLYLAFGHFNGQIDRIGGLFDGLRDRPAAARNGAQNFLLVGSDSRDGDNGIGTQGSGATYVTGQRSDTIILIHLFGKVDKAELISFPRDSYVEIPAYTGKTGVHHAAHHNKLNSAFALGGAPLLISTIEHLTNLRVDHYLQVDFTGFKTMVNQVGGVDVCLTKPAKDHFSGINLSAGHHRISGDVALAFVRQRHGLPNGDIDRIARQQQFIGSLVHKVLSKGTLLNLVKLNGFLDAATHSLKADDKLTGNDIRKLALQFKSFSSGGVSFATVPIVGNARRNGAAVVLLDEPKMATMFETIANDQAPGSPPKPGKKAPSVPLIVAPGSVRVSVFNGSGINGLGRKANEDLAAVGFQTVGIAQTRGTGLATTTIFYGPSKSDSARTLQAAIPGSVLQPDGSLGRTLEVVVGTNYTGAQKVTLSGPKKPTTTKPGAQTPLQTAQDNPCTS
jgi:LCP family protein required for cell wall assembly